MKAERFGVAVDDAERGSGTVVMQIRMASR
jgi:hypothetical protein